MHKIAKGLAAAFIAVSTATAQTPAMAVQASPSTQSPETEPESTNSAAIDSLARNAQAEKENRQILGAEAASFESSMKKAFNEDAVLKNGQFIDYKSISVKQTSEGYYYASAPIKGLTDGSIAVAGFSPTGTLENTVQINLAQATETTGTVSVFVNGDLQKEEFVEVGAQTTNPSSPSERMVTPYGMNWGALSDCLNSQGIASWAVAALSLACSAGCLVTLGTACLICISAATGATVGVIQGCAFNSWE